MLRGSSRREVDEFIAARSPGLLRTAYLLTGERDAAELLLQSALAEVWETWHRSELGPELTARRALVRANRTWRQPRRPRRSTSVGELDSTETATWARLDRLSRRQRAALVLRVGDGLSDTDLASALECSEGAAGALARRAVERVGLEDPHAALESRGEALDDVPGRTLAQHLGDVEHRVEVRRAWRRTEALASRVVATAAAIAVVAVLPSATPTRPVRTPQPRPTQAPPLLVGRQLSPVLRVNDVDYEYFTSQESLPGRTSLRVKVATELQPQAVAWVSPGYVKGHIVATLDGDRVKSGLPGRLESGLLLTARRSHVLVIRATRPTASLRLGVAIYEWPKG